MRVVCSVGCLLFYLLTSAQTYFAQADSTRKSRGIPAIVYAIFNDKGIIESGATGYRKYRARDSVRITDRFQVGTNSFAFVSWVAGKLVESGKIKWTTTFNSLFPEYNGKVLPQFANLNLQSLLSNTGALQPYKDMNDYVHVPVFNGDMPVQRKEFAAWILQRPGLNDAREKKMVESIAGYTIAVAMLEKASGQPWEKLMDTYINKPLGISVKFGWPNAVSPDQPWGHWAKYGGLSPEPADTWVKQYPPTLAASGANLSLVDYVKFLQQELAGLRGAKTSLSQRTLELIHFGNDYPLGWESILVDNKKIAQHTGESYLFSSHVELIPEKNIGIIVLCNDGDSMGKGAVINLSRVIRDSLLNR